MIDLINEYYSNYYMDFHSLRQKEYLFLNYHGNQLTRQSIKKIIDDYIEVSKMDLKLTAHVFRHLCATHLLENGVNLEDLQGYLGHEHISSTEVYLTLSPKFIQKQYLKHHFIK